MERITVRARADCKYCLGSGKASTIFAVGESICSCVTEQLRIIVVEKDLSIPGHQRYTPGEPEFVQEEKIREGQKASWKRAVDGTLRLQVQESPSLHLWKTIGSVFFAVPLKMWLARQTLAAGDVLTRHENRKEAMEALAARCQVEVVKGSEWEVE